MDDVKIKDIVARLKRFKGPHLGDGVHPGVLVPDLVKCLDELLERRDNERDRNLDATFEDRRD